MGRAIMSWPVSLAWILLHVFGFSSLEKRKEKDRIDLLPSLFFKTLAVLKLLQMLRQK